MNEIALLLTRIEQEYQAMQNGLTGLAAGTTRHSFIQARLQKVENYQLQLTAALG